MMTIGLTSIRCFCVADAERDRQGETGLKRESCMGWESVGVSRFEVV